jgi:hypothetical protein
MESVRSILSRMDLRFPTESFFRNIQEYKHALQGRSVLCLDKPNCTDEEREAGKARLADALCGACPCDFEVPHRINDSILRCIRKTRARPSGRRASNMSAIRIVSECAIPFVDDRDTDELHGSPHGHPRLNFGTRNAATTDVPRRIHDDGSGVAPPLLLVVGGGGSPPPVGGVSIGGGSVGCLRIGGGVTGGCISIGGGSVGFTRNGGRVLVWGSCVR